MTNQLFDPGETVPTKELAKRCTPAKSGTGPQGETCRTCQHYTRLGYHDGVYLKYGKMQHAWTHGGGSDIRAKWSACSEWEAKGVVE